jgi:hypothetical protein
MASAAENTHNIMNGGVPRTHSALLNRNPTTINAVTYLLSIFL